MLTKEKTSHIADLSCSECGRSYPVNQVNTFASCEQCEKNPLIARYDLSTVGKEDIAVGRSSMWRYFPCLPVLNEQNIVTLGEGWTPILSLNTNGQNIETGHLLLKDESQNPTGSFKARGLSAAVSKAKELGIQRCIIPTAGNAGGAMSAYCAKAGLQAVVVMPRHTPQAFKDECLIYGAQVILVDGLISDCAKKVAELNREGEYFDMSTFREPYRLEGKKTLGYEIAEQFNWFLPDVILYPTGGGTGLLGIWKAFHEMITMGWISNKLPRMIAIQAHNCQPIAQTWLGLQANAKQYQGKPTIASGLAVPNPFAEKLILKVIHESGGAVETVTEGEILASVKKLASSEGLLLAPEGAALFPALKKLLDKQLIKPDERVLLLNTGSGYKYLENLVR
jgi:threonine synthase